MSRLYSIEARISIIELSKNNYLKHQINQYQMEMTDLYIFGIFFLSNDIKQK